MPTYDYRCSKCKRRFELFHSITDDTPKRCPRCKAKAVRVPGAGAGLLFKGSGFHITDYRSKSYREKAKQEGGGGEGKGSKPSADKGAGSGGADKKTGPSGKSAKGG